MAEEKTETPAAAAPAAGGGGGGNKTVMLLTVVNLVATLAMVGVLVVSFQKDRKKPSVEDIAASAPAGEGGEKGKAEGEAKAEGGEGAKSQKKADEFGKVVPLDQFTVNLSTPGSVNPRFFRANISLQVPNDDTENEVNAKMPQIRNAIIDLINSKRPTDLSTAEGRDYLKEEIKNALNGVLVNGKVTGVYFTSFVVSS